MAQTFFGAWLFAAAYSWVAREAFGLDAGSPWNWGVAVAIVVLAVIGEGAEQEERRLAAEKEQA